MASLSNIDPSTLAAAASAVENIDANQIAAPRNIGGSVMSAGGSSVQQMNQLPRPAGQINISHTSAAGKLFSRVHNSTASEYKASVKARDTSVHPQGIGLLNSATSIGKTNGAALRDAFENNVEGEEEEKVGIGSKVIYYIHRASTIVRLKSEMLYIQRAVYLKKGSIGEIYDKFSTGDFAGAEDIFLRSKAECDDLMWAHDRKKKELDLLLSVGESETVTRPGSEQAKRKKKEREQKIAMARERMNSMRSSMRQSNIMGGVAKSRATDRTSETGVADSSVQQTNQLSAATQIAGSSMASISSSDPSTLAAAASAVDNLDANQIAAASNLGGSLMSARSSSVQQTNQLSAATQIAGSSMASISSTDPSTLAAAASAVDNFDAMRIR